MTYKIKNSSGEWIDGQPTYAGQPIRIYYGQDFYIETTWWGE